ncbi:histidine kinase [Nocardia puris]|uniref:histidine kinase n=1 Tax=Nocardia puris TaxID=208602 RepID=A0A366DV97_9NOCA|nr:ATP-binding protein [Nocardia puris]MBF6210586.1 histidine kinase [Nocardia puris]MBF6369311.1 histidine kinase [Nocardia puris]MBF6457846.1 histidine kinase [Nocardia puris]RBO94013.1 histidine kinase/DNA gyrase B/HSP90-like ATPase [Nocardia puris]
MPLADRVRSPRLRGALILLVQCGVVLACVAATTLAASAVQERHIRTATEERVLAVSRSLAELDQVRAALGSPAAAAELQPLAELIRQASRVDYVVVTDAEGIRLTHPDPAERGRPVSTDPSAVLAGETFLGTESGTLGPTLRAKVPVYQSDSPGAPVIGIASVGILESEIAADHEESLFALVPWILAALAVGCLAAGLLAHLVNRRVRRLEDEVVELSVQRRIARALRDQTHEFRTRLHIIYGLVESDDAAGALAYIADLAPVAHTDGTGPELDDARVRALLDAAAAEFAEQGGRLEIDPLSEVDRTGIDADDLTVLSNLVRNAVEAAGPDGMVRVRIHADGTEFDLVVSDSGPGIPDDAMPRLFRHGFTTKHPTDEVSSRGVGLALVLRIVRRRGGHIDVGSSDLGGARFEVRMPAGGARDAVESAATKVST